MSVGQESHQQLIIAADRSTRAVTHSNSQKRGSYAGDEVEGITLPLRQSTTTDSILKNQCPNHFLSHQPSGCTPTDFHHQSNQHMHSVNQHGNRASDAGNLEHDASDSFTQAAAMDSALHPDAVFDLPSALCYIHGLAAQITGLEAELADARQEAQTYQAELTHQQRTRPQEPVDSGEYLGLQERHLQMEQQMLELVEERRLLREELAKRKNDEQLERDHAISLQEDVKEQALRLEEERRIREENQRSLEAQINMMQELLEKKAGQMESLEKEMEELEQRNQGLCEEVQRVKSEYRAKLLDK